MDGHPINIDRLINTLQGLKENGATHVQMEYHCDHISYPIQGYKLSVSTEEEVSNHMKKEEEVKLKRIQEQKQKLEKEIERLNKLSQYTNMESFEELIKDIESQIDPVEAKERLK